MKDSDDKHLMHRQHGHRYQQAYGGYRRVAILRASVLAGGLVLATALVASGAKAGIVLWIAFREYRRHWVVAQILSVAALWAAQDTSLVFEITHKELTIRVGRAEATSRG